MSSVSSLRLVLRELEQVAPSIWSAARQKVTQAIRRPPPPKAPLPTGSTRGISSTAIRTSAIPEVAGDVFESASQRALVPSQVPTALRSAESVENITASSEALTRSALVTRTQASAESVSVSASAPALMRLPVSRVTIPMQLARTTTADLTSLGAQGGAQGGVSLLRVESTQLPALKSAASTANARTLAADSLGAATRSAATTPRLKVALAQMEVKPGDPEANFQTMLGIIEKSKTEGAELVVFPEMSMSGYLVGDMWYDEGFCRNLMRYNEKIREASNGIAVAWGNVHMDSPELMRARGILGRHMGEDGRPRRYNAVFVAQDGQWVRRPTETTQLPAGMQPKTLLPNYAFFDDKRYFFSLRGISEDSGQPLDSLLQPFLIKARGAEVPVGFQICEDMWIQDYVANGRSINPAKALVDNGATCIVNISASPWTYGKESLRDAQAFLLKQDLGERSVPLYYVNQTGVQNNGKNHVIFDGGSTVYNSRGEIVATARQSFTPELVMVEDVESRGVVQRQLPTRAEQKFWAIVNAIRSIKDPANPTKYPKYYIGLSGGVDSALSASLLVKAVGPENVIAVNMPARANTQATRDAAKEIARQLGIEYQVVPIQTLVDANRSTLLSAQGLAESAALRPLVEENIQAKIRGTSILSNLAQQNGGLFVNNGNKLEVAFGYATLYGDWGGAVGLLGDLTKKEVFEVSRYANTLYGKQVIPEALFPDELFRFGAGKIKPGPELETGVTSPLKFGYHDALIEQITGPDRVSMEQVMNWYMDGTLHRKLGISVELLQRWGLDKPETFVKDIEWVYSTITKQRFKRVQSVPTVLTSSHAFGYDIRESMLPFSLTEEAQGLKAKILAERLSYEPRTVS